MSLNFYFNLQEQLNSAFYTWSRRNGQGTWQTVGYEESLLHSFKSKSSQNQAFFKSFFIFSFLSIFFFLIYLFFYHLIFLGKNDAELDSDDLDDDDDDDDAAADDNDEAVDNADEEESPGQAEMTEAESLKGLRGYMEQMDQELMGTNVGQSFKLAVRKCCRHSKTLDDNDAALQNNHWSTTRSAPWVWTANMW